MFTCPVYNHSIDQKCKSVDLWFADKNKLSIRVKIVLNTKNYIQNFDQEFSKIKAKIFARSLNSRSCAFNAAMKNLHYISWDSEAKKLGFFLPYTSDTPIYTRDH